MPRPSRDSPPTSTSKPTSPSRRPRRVSKVPSGEAAPASLSTLLPRRSSSPSAAAGCCASRATRKPVTPTTVTSGQRRTGSRQPILFRHGATRSPPSIPPSSRCSQSSRSISPPSSGSTTSSSAGMLATLERLALAVASEDPTEARLSTREEQVAEIARLVGAIDLGGASSGRLHASILLLRAEHAAPSSAASPSASTPSSCRTNSALSGGRGGVDSVHSALVAVPAAAVGPEVASAAAESLPAVCPDNPRPTSEQPSFVESLGNAVVSGSVVTCEIPSQPERGETAQTPSAAQSEREQPQGVWRSRRVESCCARGEWQRGENSGVVSFTFRVRKSLLGDADRVEVGLVSQGLTGRMGDAIVLNGGAGQLKAGPHDATATAAGTFKTGEPLIPPGSLRERRGLGALVEVQADTLRNELRFQVTDARGHRYPWHTATVRKRAVPLPAVFAPFVRLTKVGDAVEILRATTFIPEVTLKEQLVHPALAVQLPLLEKALGMPDPRVSESTIAAARLKLTEAREAQAMAHDGSGCAFFFLDADALRSSTDSMPLLLPMQELMQRHPEWFVTQILTLEDACMHTFATEFVAVSHRWDDRSMPDPEGVQLEAIRQFLHSRPWVKRVWIDYCCLPQSSLVETNTRTEEEQQLFSLSLKNVNLLFLGLGVLVLTDRSYLSRFWTQFEAWLSLMDVAPSGLVSASHHPSALPEHSRCQIICVHGAPVALVESLIEEWSGCTAAKAFEKLGSADVMVTNQADKDMCLPKILELDDKVSAVAARVGLPEPGTPEHDDASAPPVRREKTT